MRSKSWKALKHCPAPVLILSTINKHSLIPSSHTTQRQNITKNIVMNFPPNSYMPPRAPPPPTPFRPFNRPPPPPPPRAVPPPPPRAVPPPPPRFVPPPPPRVTPPPPPRAFPPPPPRVTPPPPPRAFPPPPPRVLPPPPPRFMPPPPHVLPPPPPPLPPDNHPIVIVIVIVSFGTGLLFLACLFALWCFLKKRKKKIEKTHDEIVKVDEHFKIKEAIEEGPHGKKTVVLSVEDDVHMERMEDDKMKKEESLGQENMQKKSAEVTPGDLEGARSSSSPKHRHHHLHPKHDS